MATAPVVLVRVAEFNNAKKAEEMQKDYFPEDQDESKEKEKKSGDDYLGGR